MKIRQIKNDDWAGIMRVQNEAYIDIVPESEPVLKRNYVVSPETCLVAADVKGKISGYVLAHPWAPDSSPALYTEIDMPGNTGNTKNLFIHDLAVLTETQGKGVGRKLYDEIFCIARSRGFKSMSLVAIQGADLFWGKLGFKENRSYLPSPTYGEKAIFMQLEFDELLFPDPL